MKKRIFLISIAFVLSIVFLSGLVFSDEKAASSDPSLLSLERIFSSEEFTPEEFGQARWLKHKSGYIILEDSAGKDKEKDIVHYDPKTGKRRIEVAAARLIPEGQDSPLEIDDFQWSDDGKWLLIFTNSKKVWRQKTRGDYWVLNLENQELWKLGGDAKSSSLMFAKFSPDSTRVAYVHKNNIFVEHLVNKSEKRRIIQLTKDGSKTIINGTFDWVYEEEFHMRDGFRWSPDSKHIAYWQLDSNRVGIFKLINNTDSIYPEVTSIPYPKPGTTNSACRIGVVSAEEGATRWFKLPGDSRNHYIARMEWAANSEEIVFQRLNRLQNTDWVILGNINTSQVRTILVEKDDTWVDVVDEIKWLNKGKRFIWISERDGWRHVYVVSRSGKDIRLITPGDYDVIDVLEVDKKKGWLYFTASPENPRRCYLYRVRLNGQGKAQQLTPINIPGSHSYQFSPDCQWAFHTYSSFETPPRKELVRMPGHKKIRTLVDNKKLRDKLEVLKRHGVEFFRVDIGQGILLDAWCMKPPDFDPSKRYPVLFYVYGEPWGQTVLDRWRGNSYLWYVMLTQQGYMVMSVDNRGTPAPRGREWRKCVYRQIGILASTDQAAAVRAIIKNRSYIDSRRIGVWGWSGGGSMTLNAMFRYPDLYHTGMSVAPVPDQRLYDSIYQERYMGLPEDNKEGYEKGSPITFAHQLKGNLLVVHGTGDDNVHYQGTERLINKLIEHNKPFTMMAYPNRSHGIREGENTTRHLYELLTRYLKHNLPPTAGL
ncbi:MAG: prolyl oligopeptidase family serine peptidase [Candidatus Aminicenantes bacterium]|nr:prolyl oligopeptidase family serine peptidase [Candidatus Aminicenantes bacterium]NIM78745.1 prolyl oligopeptidase family serine peptidase [Candidatus Aminicenantes bacterium]NIN18000.1 prolyl oligopeptidase family serine peptidase [Candidatus Aminicenantes bacterium]NIN41900.1 prolyl oligopeptidase family serine peptidase [Candidatus Aminicenantes bacterium]NIN84655.1 prolyl oligopeptidase family serine peptidase [Candidatus Aminicenantes bacterium]